MFQASCSPRAGATQFYAFLPHITLLLHNPTHAHTQIRLTGRRLYQPFLGLGTYSSLRQMISPRSGKAELCHVKAQSISGTLRSYSYTCLRENGVLPVPLSPNHARSGFRLCGVLFPDHRKFLK